MAMVYIDKPGNSIDCCLKLLVILRMIQDCPLAAPDISDQSLSSDHHQGHKGLDVGNVSC